MERPNKNIRNIKGLSAERWKELNTKGLSLERWIYLIIWIYSVVLKRFAPQVLGWHFGKNENLSSHINSSISQCQINLIE